MKKKILAIDQGEFLGGAERFLAEALTRLSETFEIYLLTSGAGEYLKLFENSSITLHKVSIPRLKPLGLKSLFRYKSCQRQLKEKISSIQPDLILSNTVRTHLLVSPLSAKFSIPLIWMAHDRTFPHFLLKRFLQYPNLIICCSGFTRDYYQSTAPEKRFQVIYPFGIGESQTEQLQTITKENLIGMVGRFVPWKGQNLFISTAAALHQRFPEYRFEIIGAPYLGRSDSEAYFQQCQKQIQEQGLSEVLTIKQHVPDLLQEIACWKVLVHCSKEPEPLGRVILEGMAAGCTVFASDMGGPKEIIRHGETGMLFSPNQEKDLGQRLSALLENPKQLQELSSRSQQYIQEHYQWKRVLSDLGTAIESCL